MKYLGRSVYEMGLLTDHAETRFYYTNANVVISYVVKFTLAENKFVVIPGSNLVIRELVISDTLIFLFKHIF